MLLALHEQQLPDALPVAPHVEYRIPPYDIDAFLIEAELLLDWYLPRLDAAIPDSRARARSARSGASCCSRRSRRRRPGCCATSIRPTCSGCRSAASIARLGLLDFQDAADGPGRLRPRLAAAGRARRRAGTDRARAARPLRARRAAEPIRASMPPHSSRSTRRSRRSAPPRSSASSRGSTGATASRNICVTCRGYGATCSARSAIRRWSRSRPGTSPTCRR